MLRTLVSPVADTTLEVEDFAHIKDHIDHLDRLITDARQPHAILIYGPPGTGKTELAETDGWSPQASGFGRASRGRR